MRAKFPDLGARGHATSGRPGMTGWRARWGCDRGHGEGMDAEGQKVTQKGRLGRGWLPTNGRHYMEVGRG